MVTIKDKGLGDTINRFTTFTGIKKIIKKINPNCDCEERKEWFNKKIPYKN